MTHAFEHLIAHIWNHAANSRSRQHTEEGIELGSRIAEGGDTGRAITLARGLRTQHLAELGRTGTGKSSLFLHMIRQHLTNGEGFAHLDLHGDSTAYILKLIAWYEVQWHCDLSHRLILIEPADPLFAVGLNVIQTARDGRTFVQIAEFAQILKTRWKLETLGARTEELLRNSLHLLADNNLTLIELGPLLTNATFRAECLRHATNAEVSGYFESRYNVASPGMQASLRDPVLNKITGFVADPNFRHIVGQRQTTFSLVDAIDQGYWILLNIDKARLGEQAVTLGSLFLAQFKNAFFARRRREIYTLYLDEVQNLVSSDNALETLLSESRKFSCSICLANQFLEQLPPGMRAALLACGSHVFFRLSPPDADKIAAALDGGRPLGETLKNLGQRHFVSKIGNHAFQHGTVPQLPNPRVETNGLIERCRARWARRRTEIEEEIRRRVPPAAPTPQNQQENENNDRLDNWE
jgi:hypothetical protein